MEKTAELLPAEVAQIAESVSVEKRNEVQAVLNHVFNGVSKMRDQLETVVVEDENDQTNMKLANTIRLGVKRVRLDAEKTFDAKRAEVQEKKRAFDTEDKLWLKAKQTMQILTKEIEENAKWKEETKLRFEAEQRELKIQQRMVKVSKVAPEIDRSEFEGMSDEIFDKFYNGLEKEYNERIEAEKKAEADRIAKEKAEAEERERIRKENEQLKKEAEERERQAKIEAQKRAEAERKREALDKAASARMEMLSEIGVALDFNTCRNMNESAWNDFYEAKNKEYQSEQNRIWLEKQKAEQEQKKQQEAREKAEAELKAKLDAEKAAAEAEEKRMEAELNKGDAAKVKDLISDLEALKSKYTFKSAKNKKMYDDVSTLIDKVINHINK